MKTYWLIIITLSCVVAVGIVKWPEPESLLNVKLGAYIAMTPKRYNDLLKDVSTRKGLEKLTRKEADPISRAVAKGAAAPIVDRFVAAATDTLTVEVSGQMLAGTPGTQDSVAVQPKDTVCVGVGGSQRGKNLTLFSACAPGKDGTINRYKGSNFDWSYESGQPVVSATRMPDVMPWVWRIVAAAMGYGAARLGL